MDGAAAFVMNADAELRFVTALLTLLIMQGLR
jgi:hypothetical protein